MTVPTKIAKMGMVMLPSIPGKKLFLAPLPWRRNSLKATASTTCGMKNMNRQSGVHIYNLVTGRDYGVLEVISSFEKVYLQGYEFANGCDLVLKKKQVYLPHILQSTFQLYVNRSHNP